MREQKLAKGKVVYRPPERAISGRLTIAPFEAPNHVKVERYDGTVEYIELSSVVKIEEMDSNV